MYGLHGSLIANPGEGENLARILMDASKILKDTKGCKLYIVGRNPVNQEEIWVTEIWESKEDHDRSLSLPLIKNLIARAIPLLNKNPEKGQEWEILGGAGIN